MGERLDALEVIARSVRGFWLNPYPASVAPGRAPDQVLQALVIRYWDTGKGTFIVCRSLSHAVEGGQLQ